MNKDFGYFLITIGLGWLLFITPINVSFMNHPLAIPIGLIIIGCIALITGFFGIKHVSGIALFLFIILWFKAGFFMPYFFWDSSGHFDYSINDSLNRIMIECSFCDDSLISSDELFIVNISHPSSIPVKFNKNEDELFLNVNGGKSLYQIPTIDSLNYKLGIGDLKINGVKASQINVSTGIGSVMINITEVIGNSSIDINTGIGSINILLPTSIDYHVDARTGLGIINNALGTNSSDYDTASNRIYVKAETGIGSIEIK